LTKNIKNINASSGTSTPTTLALPIPAGQPLPTGHLSTKDQQVMAKIQGEWNKVEQLQAEKIRLATRLEQIVSRARERGKAEWRRVGGMDLEEIENKEGKPVFGELGGADVLLPLTGLGPGSDRPIKSKSSPALPSPRSPS
jgi:chromatin modification-related protein YNG2